jgi:hypothetical protein
MVDKGREFVILSLRLFHQSLICVDGCLEQDDDNLLL